MQLIPSQSEMVPVATAADLRAVIRYLYQIEEMEKIALHRALHDSLGGLMVSAGMDLAMLERNGNEEAGERQIRARSSLMKAVEINRQLTESLRPSLLDNLGLFAALRWHIKQRCPAAPVVCRESYPDQELALTAEATTGLYRIARESLFLIVEEPDLLSIDLDIAICANSWLRMVLTHEHATGEAIELFRDRPEVMFGFAERTRALKGEMRVARTGTVTSLIYEFPLAEITCA